jgi:hypothetical protein
MLRVSSFDATTSCLAMKFGWHVADSSLHLPTFSLSSTVCKNIFNIYHFFTIILEINFQKKKRIKGIVISKSL